MFVRASSISKRTSMTSQLIIVAIFYLCSLTFGQHLSGRSLVLVVLTLLISTTVRQLTGRYDARRSRRASASAYNDIVGWCITVALLLLLGAASDAGAFYDQRVILTWFVATPFALLLSHALMDGPRFDQEGSKMRSVIVIGANDVGARFADTCTIHPTLSIHMHGYFDDRSEMNSPRNLRYPILGKLSDIGAYVRKYNIKMIFISQPVSAHPRIRQLIDELHDTTASVYFLPDIYTFNLMQGRIDAIGGMPVIAICETPLTGMNSSIKRASDLAFGLLILLACMPLMLVIAVAIKWSSPGPAIFRQRRYGLDGEEIIVYKFRSMRVSEDGGTIKQASKNDPRVTKLGAFLRRSSLDELPQFINVLQGRMSIVGPRPHAVAHNELYRKLIKGYMLRHKVKPGITGWAQVNGLRGETATLDRMQARIDYDLAYLREWSIWRDMWIMVLTVKTVMARENAH